MPPWFKEGLVSAQTDSKRQQFYQGKLHQHFSLLLRLPELYYLLPTGFIEIALTKMAWFCHTLAIASSYMMHSKSNRSVIFHY